MEKYNVTIILYTREGEVIAKSQEMDEDRLKELRDSLGYKLVSPSYYLDLDTNSGFILVPHDILINSVIDVKVEKIIS